MTLNMLNACTTEEDKELLLYVLDSNGKLVELVAYSTENKIFVLYGRGYMKTTLEVE